MVERPIKKSERQIVAEPSEQVLETEPSRIEGSQDSITQSPVERSISPPLRGKDKTKGKGKGNQQEDERSRSNPALVRGPRPTRPKPPVTKPQEEKASDLVTEDVQDETAEV